MAVHIWSVLCSRVVIDKETNQANLMGTVDGLTVELAAPLPQAGGLPLFVPFGMDLVSLWERSDKEETATFRCRLTAPNGVVLGNAIERIDLSAGPRVRSIVRIESFLLAGEGIFHFTVSLKKGERWVRVARLPLEITIEIRKPLKP
jgi:hypothetical protein